MTQAIFQSTQQAIHFSYIVTNMPPKSSGGLGEILDRMKLEATGMREEREVSTVCFAGLSELDIRAQCAMVRSAVEKSLPPPESFALRSRWGYSMIRRGPGGSIISANYGDDRARSMRRLALYLGISFPNLSSRALLLIIARVCGDCDQLIPTFRQIEQDCGTSRSTVERYEKIIKKRIRELVNLGVNRLTPAFVRDGLVIEES